MRSGFIASVASSGSGPGTPGRPTNVSGTAVSSGQIDVTWTAPLSDGGSPITDYDVQYSSDSGSTWTTWADGGSALTSRSVTGLTNGTLYTFRVFAKNAIGSGPLSINNPDVSAAGAPTATTNVGEVTTATPTVTTDSATAETFNTNTTVTLTGSGTWTNPYQSGSTTGTATLSGTTSVGTLDYIYGTTNGGPYGSTSSNGLLTGLTRGTTYYCKARGTNSSCTALLKATVNPNGGPTTVTFEYGTISGVYTQSVTLGSPIGGINNVAVSASITSPPSNIYYRVKATNSVGTTYGSQVGIVLSSTTAQGSQLSFTPPFVDTMYDLTIVGGGGGGSVGGGGGGQVLTYATTSVGASFTYAVGAGGSGASDVSNNAAGGTSTTTSGLSGVSNANSGGAGLGVFDGNTSKGGNSGSGNAGGTGIWDVFNGYAGGGGGGQTAAGTAALAYYAAGPAGEGVSGMGGGGGGGVSAATIPAPQPAIGKGGGGNGSTTTGANGASTSGGGGGGGGSTGGNGGSGKVSFYYKGPA